MESRGLLNKPIRVGDGTRIFVLAGHGKAVAVEMSEDELRRLKKMSKDKRDAFVRDAVIEGYEKTKGMMGYCVVIKKEVSVLNCVRCAQKHKRFTEKLAWDTCIRQHILGQDVDLT